METQLLEAMAADLAFGLENLRTRAEQQRLQAAIVKVAKAVSAGTGVAFFDHLAQHMADALSAQVACVVRLQPPVDGQSLQGRRCRISAMAWCSPRSNTRCRAHPARNCSPSPWS